MNKDTMNIKEWAARKELEYIETIKQYIDSGIDNQTAINMVLEKSTLGVSYKDSIIIECRNYKPSHLMVEGEGAPQYTMFDLPKDTQLALL